MTFLFFDDIYVRLLGPLQLVPDDRYLTRVAVTRDDEQIEAVAGLTGTAACSAGADDYLRRCLIRDARRLRDDGQPLAALAADGPRVYGTNYPGA
jgi:hypothetical protein